MSRSRVPLVLGLTAAGGVGYYLYGAGGSPKVAEKNFEGTTQDYTLTRHFPVNTVTHQFTTIADAHKASAKIRSEMPGRGSQAQKEAEAYGQQAGAKFDSAVSYFALRALLLSSGQKSKSPFDVLGRIRLLTLSLANENRSQSRNPSSRSSRHRPKPRHTRPRRTRGRLRLLPSRRWTSSTRRLRPRLPRRRAVSPAGLVESKSHCGQMRAWMDGT